jgi:hypothetical protein
MTVRDTVLLAAKILGIEKEVAAYFDGESNEMETQAERLLSALHLAECSLALDYVPLHAEEELYTTAGRVDFSNLSNSPVRITAVTDIYGEPIAYTLYSKYIKTTPGVVRVQYTYTPRVKELEDECDFDLLSSDSILVYGILSEYCLGEGLVAEAAEWERKWKDLISTIYHTEKCKRLGSRRWI